MQKTKIILSLIVVVSLCFVQVGGVFAAPALQNSNPVTGIVQSITLETDPTTGVTTVIVDLIDGEQMVQHVRVSQESAIGLGLVVVNGDGKPGINNRALGKPIEIDSNNVIPTQEESQHPVASALATFFSDIAGVNYEAIMSAHDQGIGFGTIAQTLWLTKKLEGDSNVFEALLKAKQTNDYSAFVFQDGSVPENWGQLKKAILAEDTNNSVGAVMSDLNGNENGVGNDKEKSNNGNGNGAGNGSGDGNNSNKDKDKDNNKDREKDK